MSNDNDIPKNAAVKSFLKELIDGSLLAKELVLKQLSYILFITFLALVYIANRYHAEKLVIESSKIKKELIELKYEAISIEADLMFKRNQTEVKKMVDEYNLGLQELFEPPRKIVIK